MRPRRDHIVAGSARGMCRSGASGELDGRHDLRGGSPNFGLISVQDAGLLRSGIVDRGRAAQGRLWLDLTAAPALFVSRSEELRSGPQGFSPDRTPIGSLDWC